MKDYLDVPWDKSSVDLILECTGKNKSPKDLNPYFDSLGIKKVIVACNCNWINNIWLHFCNEFFYSFVLNFGLFR